MNTTLLLARANYRLLNDAIGLRNTPRALHYCSQLITQCQQMNIDEAYFIYAYRQILISMRYRDNDMVTKCWNIVKNAVFYGAKNLR